MLLWIGLGTISCYFYNSLIAGFYLAFSLIMVFIVMRKIVCTNCYYYNKRCANGWGKLSALFFKKGNIENFSTSFGVKIAPFVYGSLTIIPLVFIVISLIQEFTSTKIIVLVLLILISIYSGGIGRTKGCRKCKMKYICPGSADKS